MNFVVLRMFDYNLSDNLKFKILKLRKKDIKKTIIINKKIKQVISCDDESINHYKNLKKPLNELKRVHIDKSFVLVFKVDIKNNFVLFVDFDHHDRIYK
jgi:YafQ family addiction module toxin component